MRRFSLILIWVIQLLIIQELQAQDFKVDVPYDTVYLGNTVTVTFIAENIPGRIEANLSGLPIISGPNQSSSTMMINGESNSSKSMSFVLEPQEVGFLEIEPAYLHTSDEILETTPLLILVLDNPDQIIQDDKSKDGGFFFNDQFFKSSPRPSLPAKKSKKKRKLKKI